MWIRRLAQKVRVSATVRPLTTVCRRSVKTRLSSGVVLLAAAGQNRVTKNAPKGDAQNEKDDVVSEGKKVNIPMNTTSIMLENLANIMVSQAFAMTRSKVGIEMQKAIEEKDEDEENEMTAEQWAALNSIILAQTVPRNSVYERQQLNAAIIAMFRIANDESEPDIIIKKTAMFMLGVSLSSTGELAKLPIRAKDKILSLFGVKPKL